MISVNKYQEALKIVEKYKKDEETIQINLFKESDILKIYLTTPNGFDDLLSHIDNFYQKGININNLIDVILTSSYHYSINENNNVDNKLKKLLLILLDKYKFEKNDFINNTYLDYYKNTFISLLSFRKILNDLNTKSILRIRDYIGSNASINTQINFLHIYILIIRRVEKSKLLDMGNRYIDEYKAFTQCFENV